MKFTTILFFSELAFWDAHANLQSWGNIFLQKWWRNKRIGLPSHHMSVKPLFKRMRKLKRDNQTKNWDELEAECSSLQNLLCFDWGKTDTKRFSEGSNSFCSQLSEGMILGAPSDFTVQRKNCLDSGTLWQGFVIETVFVWQVFTPLFALDSSSTTFGALDWRERWTTATPFWVKNVSILQGVVTGHKTSRRDDSPLGTCFSSWHSPIKNQVSQARLLLFFFILLQVSFIRKLKWKETSGMHFGRSDIRSYVRWESFDKGKRPKFLCLLDQDQPWNLGSSQSFVEESWTAFPN